MDFEAERWGFNSVQLLKRLSFSEDEASEKLAFD